MYLHQKPQPQPQPQLHLQPFNFHKQEHHCTPTTMMIEVTSNPTPLPPPSHHHHQILLIDTTSSGGEDNTTTTTNPNNNNPDNIKAPKKRAETWVQEETRTLISLRRESDSLFNTSKSNKHLWDQISGKMREKGFDRSPTMCTDKWRNLLKEFKKAKQHQDRGGGNGSAKMSYYKEIEEILRDRSKNGAHYKTSPGSKVDSFMQFSDKGIDDTSITFGPVEANGRATLNLESRLDHEGHPLAITAADTVTASGVSPWNWRETPGNG